VEQEGVDAWFDLEAESLIGKDAQDYEKSTDILDVWFDSGVTHACVLKARPELQYPADLYLEGSDQHRGWFQSSLLTSVATEARAPYRSVLTHGFTVDAKGMKMSKSQGNVVVPQKVINTLGADILRLWVASTDYRAEMSISDEILKRMADSYRRIRNTARYLLGNLAGFDPVVNRVPVEQMLALDQWALAQAGRLQEELIRAYDDFAFHIVYQKLHQYCSVDLGSFYLDVLKDRLYTTKPDSLARRSAQTAMYHILEGLARWMAPILSFTAEEIWRYAPGAREDSVFYATWHTFPATDALPEVAQPFFWDSVLAVREQVARELEKLRVYGGIGAGLDAEVDVYCDGAVSQALSSLGEELRFVFITSEARVHPLLEAPADATTASVQQGRLAIKVHPSAHGKCVRCWHHRPDVGAHPEHPQLCGRCVANAVGAGEERRFA
jgi:isoleucyl-tRNA synthetase